ncbi:MAG: hypothetical protein MNPFHGCM_00291 [Gemmatimonadaceae bacterium]|nr:hypothetical protein [Gemmatimonadaceae bacterium]
MLRTLSFVLLAVAACADAPQSHVTVDILPASNVVQPTVSASGGVRWLNFRVEAVIRNQGPESVFLPFCAVSIELEEGSRWITAWWPLCTLIAVPPRELPAGQELHVTLPISAALNGPGGPEWRSSRIGGRYRLVFGMLQQGSGAHVSAPLRPNRRVSSPFVLEEPYGSN